MTNIPTSLLISNIPVNIQLELTSSLDNRGQSCRHHAVYEALKKTVGEAKRRPTHEQSAQSVRTRRTQTVSCFPSCPRGWTRGQIQRATASDPHQAQRGRSESRGQRSTPLSMKLPPIVGQICTIEATLVSFIFTFAVTVILQ